MIEDLRQPAVAGPSVQVNEVGCDADRPVLTQRQCDEFGPVLAVSGNDIDSTGAASGPVVIDGQVKATRVAPELSVVAKGRRMHW